MDLEVLSLQTMELPIRFKTLVSQSFDRIEECLIQKIKEERKNFELELKKKILKNFSYSLRQTLEKVEFNCQQLENMRIKFEELLSLRLDLFSKKVEMFIIDIKEKLEESFFKIISVGDQESMFSINKLQQISCLKLNPKGIKNCFEIIQDHNVLAVAEENGIISVWDSLKFKKVSSTKAFNSEISSLKYVPNYKIIYTSSRNKLKAFLLTNKKTLKLIKSYDISNNLGFVLPIGSINKIVISEGLKTTSIRSLRSFKLKGELSKTGYSGFFIQKYKYVVIDYFDGLIGLCDVENSREISRVETGQKFSSVLSWAFCGTKNYLFAALKSGMIRIWSLSSDGFMYLKDRIAPKVSCLSWNLNNNIIFSCSDRALWSYDVEEHETTPLIYTDINIKDFKIDFKNNLLFCEQPTAISVLKYS